MTTLDQFASVFRSAVKPVYTHVSKPTDRVVLITDLSREESEEYLVRVQSFLVSPVLSWEMITGDEYETTIELLELVEARQADLICCYRNLHSQAWQHPHSLGAHLDVLIQKTASVVLVLPHPEARYARKHAFEKPANVLAMTDHMTDDNELVNYAAGLADDNGSLYLAHFEDDIVFDRYMDAIGKISTIDTDTAVTAIRDQLIKAPKDYIDSCRTVLAEHCPTLNVVDIVTFGHRLQDCLSAVNDHHINLLVIHGRDEDQHAMHGLSYPLAIQLRQIPILFI
jgi:hypothetical protein